MFGSFEVVENHRSPGDNSSSSENALSLANLESCITSPATSAYSDFALDDAIIENEIEANRESLHLDAEEVVHDEVQETQASSGAPTYLCPVCGNQVQHVCSIHFKLKLKDCYQNKLLSLVMFS